MGLLLDSIQFSITLDHNNPTESAQDALQIMAQGFPQEVSPGFTVSEWKDLSYLAEPVSVT